MRNGGVILLEHHRLDQELPREAFRTRQVACGSHFADQSANAFAAAIGIPCSIFGLSPLFLSSLATFFTSTAEATTFGASNGELDPGRWLLFLAALLAVVNTIGGFVLKELPWDDDHEVRRGRVEDSGFVPSASPSLSDVDEPSERTSLLPTTCVF